MLLEIAVLSQIKSIRRRFGSVYSQLAPRQMLLATAALIYLEQPLWYVYIVYPLGPNPCQYLSTDRLEERQNRFN